MNCPACGNVLAEVMAGDITVDVCRDGCGGVWFDQFELQNLDNPDEYAGADLLVIEPAADVTVDKAQRTNCPNCDGIVMARHFFSVRMGVEIDECPKCGGVWLDHGELAKVREQFDSDDEMDEAAAEHFSQVLGKEFAAMAAESEQDRQRATKLANLFRFLCPSYYLAGKQDGGAF